MTIRDKHKNSESLETNALFAPLFYANPIPSTIETNEGIFVDVNPAYEELTGLSREKIIGSNAIDLGLVTHETREAILAAIKTTGGSLRNLEVVMLTADRHLRTILLSSEVVNIDGVPYRFSSSIDITASKKMLKELMESHEKLERVLEVETVGVMFWDLDTGIMTDANDTLLRMLGYSRKELESGILTWQKLTPPEYIEASLNEIKKFQETGRVGPYEKEYFSKDGTRCWYVFAGSALSGNTCVEFCVDISNQKQAEKERHEIDERFRIAQELSPDGFTILRPVRDDSGRVVDFTWVYENRSIAELNGTDPQKVVGKRLLDLFPGHRDSKFMQTYIEVVESQKTITFEDEYSGETMSRPTYFRIVVVPMGEDIAILAQDITEKRLLETSLEELVRKRTHQLEEAQETLVRKERLATIGQIAGSIGHELRNPLAVISNSVFLLRNSVEGIDETAKEHLDMIMSEVNSSSKIIKDLLDFGRRDYGEKVRTNLVGIVNSLLDAMEIPESIDLLVDTDRDVPDLMVDPDHLGQILENLISNAINAMVGNPGRLEVAVRNSGEEVVLVVADNGSGITEKNLSKIFEPLFTTRSKGFGLGLSIVKSLVESNNGKIEVMSKPNGGTTFTLRFPALT